MQVELHLRAHVWQLGIATELFLNWPGRWEFVPFFFINKAPCGAL